MRTQVVHQGLLESLTIGRQMTSPPRLPDGNGNVQANGRPLTQRPPEYVPEESGPTDATSENRKQSAEEVAEKIREIVRSYQRELHFELHKDTGLLYVQVKDAENGKVLRELPMEKILDTLARIDKVVGLLLDGEV